MKQEENNDKWILSGFRDDRNDKKDNVWIGDRQYDKFNLFNFLILWFTKNKITNKYFF